MASSLRRKPGVSHSIRPAPLSCLRSRFLQVDDDNSGALDQYELAIALKVGRREAGREMGRRPGGCGAEVTPLTQLEQALAVKSQGAESMDVQCASG